MKRALVLALISTVGVGVVCVSQTLEGHWKTGITLDMTGTPWPAIDIASEVVVDYIVGDWTFSSETDIENGVWTKQDFSFAGVLGAFTVSGDVSFLPATVLFFGVLNVDVGIAMGGVSFGIQFDLTQTGAYLFLTGSGQAGDVSLDVKAVLGNLLYCDFDFSYVKIDLGFPFCCADISAEFLIGCTGRLVATFCVAGITIENLPWLTLGGCTRFVVPNKYESSGSYKNFQFESEIDLGIIGCDFDLYVRLDDQGGDMSALEIDGITFDGIEIACEIGGVEFTGITYFGSEIYMEGYAGWGYYLPGILYGYEDMDFFEAYQIATIDDTCCGPFGFDVTVFFEEDGDELFDMTYVVVNMEIQIATPFTFAMGIETDLEAGTVNDLAFTFLVEW